MSKGIDKKKRQRAACAACTVILIIIVIIMLVLYFAVYKPKDPKVQVPAMQLTYLAAPSSPSSFSINSASSPTANISLNLQVSIYNPNKATFIVEDGSLGCIYYYGTQVGFTSIPSGSIPEQSFSTITVPLAVQGSSPLSGSNLITDVSDGVLHISTAIIISGKVTTINLFTRHSEVVTRCNINVSLSTRAIISYTCQRSTSLDV